MEKPADTRHPIHELIRNRWSPRAFGDRPVETGALHRLFEAARWAPSSFNEQPWAFVVGTREKPEEHGAIGDCLVETNRWANAAPVLMVSLAKLTFAHNDKPNRHAHHDLGLAVGLMLAQATDLGLVAHQLGGFDVAKARATLQIPESYDPVAVIALGYPGATRETPRSCPPSCRRRSMRPASGTTSRPLSGPARSARRCRSSRVSDGRCKETDALPEGDSCAIELP